MVSSCNFQSFLYFYLFHLYKYSYCLFVCKKKIVVFKYIVQLTIYPYVPIHITCQFDMFNLDTRFSQHLKLQLSDLMISLHSHIHYFGGKVGRHITFFRVKTLTKTITIPTAKVQRLFYRLRRRGYWLLQYHIIL